MVSVLLRMMTCDLGWLLRRGPYGFAGGSLLRCLLAPRAPPRPSFVTLLVQSACVTSTTVLSEAGKQLPLQKFP